MTKKQKILIIVGPTASGKSSLAVELAKKFDGEIISADSRQVYKGLDIGTGKVTKREMRGVPHHLLDVASPKRRFSAANFVKKATAAHTHIRKYERLSIVVGGTGYYIDVFTGRIALPDVAPNQRLRAQLAKKSPAQLFALLKKRDPRRAQTIEPHHTRRLIRALEIASAVGKSPDSTGLRNPYFDTLWIGIAPPFARIEKNILARLVKRTRNGMIEEARRLHKSGLSYKRMEELGLEYRSLARYLRQKITKNEMIAELNRNIRRYAKKQLAYWKRNTDIRWFSPAQRGKIEGTVRMWLKT